MKNKKLDFDLGDYHQEDFSSIDAMAKEIEKDIERMFEDREIQKSQLLDRLEKEINRIPTYYDGKEYKAWQDGLLQVLGLIKKERKK